MARFFGRYAIGVVSVLLAFVLVVGLRPQLQAHTYALFLFAVMTTAVLGGLGPALVATALALVAINYADFLIHQLRFDLDDAIELAIFIAMAITISLLTAARQRAERELEAANAALRALDGAKDRFIATVSHELKSPVTVIRGWVAMLRNDIDPELRETALSAIDDSARNQARLVDDLLDTSRLMLGKLRLEIEPVSLVAVVRQCADVARNAANTKGVTLDVEVPRDPCVVDGDALRIQQICTNLLSNAVKFTPRGGRVDLRLGCDAERAEISVCDTGEGIPHDLLPSIFESLRQGDGGAAKGGLGLGLAIVKQLVAMHGGTVEAFSDGPGTGARFIVRLPLGAVPPAA